MANTELSCKELVELVTDYLEGVLPPGDRARSEAHLAYCGLCRIYIEQMRQTIAALGKLSEDSIKPQARDTLLDLFRGWKQG